jgi:hypothetical protein
MPPPTNTTRQQSLQPIRQLIRVLVDLEMTKHVEKAAASYAQDFERIIGNGDDLAKLFWNCRLADASAQQICYWLQTVLNPVPDRAPQSDKRSG